MYFRSLQWLFSIMLTNQLNSSTVLLLGNGDEEGSEPCAATSLVAQLLAGGFWGTELQ